MLVTAAAARRHETPNAVMRTLRPIGRVDRALGMGGRDAGGPGGSRAAVDREQVWTVVDGDLVVAVAGESYAVGPGDTVRLAAGAARRIAAASDVRAIVASPAAPIVTTAAGKARPLPWAA
jgi:mannose-6-phosphate isomerase-like protein (cupin superfamily)